MLSYKMNNMPILILIEIGELPINFIHYNCIVFYIGGFPWILKLTRLPGKKFHTGSKEALSIRQDFPCFDAWLRSVPFIAAWLLAALAYRSENLRMKSTGYVLFSQCPFSCRLARRKPGAKEALLNKSKGMPINVAERLVGQETILYCDERF